MECERAPQPRPGGGSAVSVASPRCWASSRAVAMGCRCRAVFAISVVALTAAACGGSHTTRTAQPDSAHAVPMVQTPAHALRLCREMRIMRPVCPSGVPAVTGPHHSGSVGAVCSANYSGALVPLDSPRCRDGEWFYIGSGGQPPGVPSGKTVIWSNPPGPPWFVHVDIIASRDSQPCAWRQERMVRTLTDRLSNEPRRPAIRLNDVSWAAHHGQLILAPPYPSGGEIGGHLAFCYSAAGVNYAVTLHAWASVFQFRINGHRRSTVLHTKPSATTVIATLRSIVSSAY